MLLAFVGSSFFTDFFIGVISALLMSRLIEPAYDSFIDLLKNNEGFLGKIYAIYSKSIGYILYSKKLHPALKSKGKEYKLYVTEGNVLCFRSDITSLRQTLLGGIIQGEMERKHLSNNTYHTYFKGFIKKENSNYLIWEERFGGKEDNVHISAKYKLANTNDEYTIGIAVEQHKDEIVQSLTLLSFSKYSFAGIKDMASKNEKVLKYLTESGIDITKLSDESDRIITI